MSTPGPPPISAPPPPIEPGSSRAGCARRGFQGCGIAALAVLVCVVGFFLYLQKRPTSLTDFLMKQIETRYGPDVTEADKEELRGSYAGFRAAVAGKRVARSGLDRVRSAVLDATRSPRVSREQVHRLAEAFRDATPPGRSLSPAPALSSTALPER